MPRRRRSPLRIVLIVLLALLVVGGIGLALAASKVGAVKGAAARARSEATEALGALRGGDLDAALANLDEAVVALEDVRGELNDPFLSMARVTPLVGGEIGRTERLVVAAADAARELRDLAEDLRPALDGEPPALVPSSGRIDLSIVPDLRSAIADRLPTLGDAVDRAEAEVDGMRFGISRNNGQVLVDELTRVRDSLADAERVLGVLPTFLGNDGIRRHLVLLQNPAESRGTGGLIGGYALLTADRGQITVSDVNSNSGLKLPVDAAPVPTPAWFAERYDRYSSRKHWSNVNIHAGLPSTGPVIADLFQRTRGITVDSVLMMDPFTLESLVGVTGPVETADLRFDAESTAETIMITAYERFGDDDPTREPGVERKPAIVALSRLLFPRLLQPSNAFGVMSALADSAGDKHFTMWSRTHAVQAMALELGIASRIRADDPLWMGFAYSNAAGNKMDTYLQTALTVDQRTEGDATIVDVTADFRLDAPPIASLPYYVAGPIAETAGIVAGQTRLLVEVFLPEGADVSAASGSGILTSTVPEATVVDATVDVYPNQPAQLRFSFRLTGIDPGETVTVLTPGTARPILVTTDAA